MHTIDKITKYNLKPWITWYDKIHFEKLKYITSYSYKFRKKDEVKYINKTNSSHNMLMKNTFVWISNGYYCVFISKQDNRYRVILYTKHKSINQKSLNQKS